MYNEVQLLKNRILLEKSRQAEKCHRDANDVQKTVNLCILCAYKTSDCSKWFSQYKCNWFQQDVWKQLDNQHHSVYYMVKKYDGIFTCAFFGLQSDIISQKKLKI